LQKLGCGGCQTCKIGLMEPGASESGLRAPGGKTSNTDLRELSCIKLQSGLRGCQTGKTGLMEPSGKTSKTGLREPGGKTSKTWPEKAQLSKIAKTWLRVCKTSRIGLMEPGCKTSETGLRGPGGGTSKTGLREPSCLKLQNWAAVGAKLAKLA